MTLSKGGLPVSGQQAEVIDHLMGNRVTVVGAGAGSGKTHTTVAALLEMVLQGDATLDQFVLITFTNKAADELRARLEKELARLQGEATTPEEKQRWRAARERLSGAFLGTIHGFCSQILRTFGYESGVARQSRVTLARTPLTEAIEDVVTHYLKEAWPAPFLLGPDLLWREHELRKQVNEILTELHNRSLDAAVLLTETCRQPDDEGRRYRIHLATIVCRVDEAYRRRKREEQALDTTDLLRRTADLLETAQGEQIVARLTQRYPHLLIDEFQDTDRVQKQIVDSLLPGLKSLLVVGDRKQSIYGFRAAEASLLEVIARENGVDVLPLSISRRPTEQLLAVQNALFQTMSDRYPELGEPLEPWGGTVQALGTVPPLTYLAAGLNPKREDVVRALGRHLQDLLRDGKIEDGRGGVRAVLPADIALLVRSNHQLRLYEEGLRALGLPVRAESGGAFFEQPEIVSTYHLLRLLLHYPDETALTLALRTPYLADVDLGGVEQSLLQYEMSGQPLTDALEERYPEIEARLRGLSALVRSETVPQILARLYEQFAIREWYRARGDDQAADNLERLREIARGLFRSEQALTVRQFVDWLLAAIRSAREEREAEVESPEGIAWIRLLTVHRAKGLEFPIVAIPDVHSPVRRDNQEPTFLVVPGHGLDVALPVVNDLDTRTNRFDGFLQQARQAAVEEEMRIFYVAVTRAQHGVILVGNARLRPNPPTDSYYSWKDEVVRARPELEAAGAHFM